MLDHTDYKGEYIRLRQRIEALAAEWEYEGAFMVNPDSKGCREPARRLRSLLADTRTEGL
jgi:hypothetical protein